MALHTTLALLRMLSSSYLRDINLISDCGGIQTGESGVITSPNYPQDYGVSSHCAWLLESPQGHTINVSADA